MSDAIITVENLSKKYLVGHQSGSQSRPNYTALRDVIGRETRNVARKTVDVVRGRQIVQGDEVEEFLGAQGCQFRGQAKRGPGNYRPQWRGQKHIAQDPEPHHRTDARAGDTSRPCVRLAFAVVAHLSLHRTSPTRIRSGFGWG
jgi:hypothetical protein